MRPCGFLVILLSAFLGGSIVATDRPNVILVLADDTGWRDPVCFGRKAVPTPHMDALAASGLRIKRFYSSSAVCSPC
jgi:arylsulfatase A-like enzyme